MKYKVLKRVDDKLVGDIVEFDELPKAYINKVAEVAEEEKPKPRSKKAE